MVKSNQVLFNVMNYRIGIAQELANIDSREFVTAMVSLSTHAMLSKDVVVDVVPDLEV
jgi:hypothetical protein